MKTNYVCEEIANRLQKKKFNTMRFSYRYCGFGALNQKKKTYLK